MSGVMRQKIAHFILIASALVVGPAGVFGEQFPRLAPAAFRELPKSVAADLDKGGCVIPQTYSVTTPHNVVAGSLRGARQKDWAVLCSDGRNSAVLVYWGGSAGKVSTLFLMPDENYIRDIGNGREGYSRRIGVVPPAQIKKKNPRAHVTHDGLEIAFIEKGSTIHYCDQGKWSRLVGAD